MWNVNFSNDYAIFLYLFNMNFLNSIYNKEAEIITKIEYLKITVDKFWKSFKDII